MKEALTRTVGECQEAIVCSSVTSGPAIGIIEILVNDCGVYVAESCIGACRAFTSKASVVHFLVSLHAVSTVQPLGNPKREV